MLHCDLRVRWKVTSDLRSRAAISEAETPSFCGTSGDLAPSTRKSLAITIVRFWCAKGHFDENGENAEFAFYPLKTRLFDSQTLANDENYENGGCHSGKGMV